MSVARENAAKVPSRARILTAILAILVACTAIALNFTDTGQGSEPLRYVYYGLGLLFVPLSVYIVVRKLD